MQRIDDELVELTVEEAAIDQELTRGDFLPASSSTDMSEPEPISAETGVAPQSQPASADEPLTNQLF